MAVKLNMPQMGYDMKEGTVVRWLKSEGTEVKVGEPVAEIETDKAVVEFESSGSGVLKKILVPEGKKVPVGEPLAIITEQGEELTEMPAAAAVTAKAVEKETAEKQVPRTAQAEQSLQRSDGAKGPQANSGELIISPAARRLAEEKGIVDFSGVKGTGPGGRITKDDILAYEAGSAAAQPETAPVVATPPTPTSPTAQPSTAQAQPIMQGGVVPLSRMRQQIAKATARSKREIPHFYVSTDIDMGQAMELRRQINSRASKTETRVSVNDLIIKACVIALKKHPKFNASFTEAGIQYNSSMNIGIAIALEEGLIVPAVLDCESKSLFEISAASKELIERTKGGTLKAQEYTGGTFSISNLGMFDVTSFTAIIVPPQAAVLAVGAVTKKPIVRDDKIEVREIMTAMLSVDHRVADGAEAARFIGEVKGLLESPVMMLV